jgi:hypothetical protein
VIASPELCFLYGLQELADDVVEVPVCVPLLFDLGNGMHHGCMVLTAEVPSDLWEGCVGHLLGQVHGNLPWHCHCPPSAHLSEFLLREAEQVGDGSLDCFDLAPTYLYIAGVHTSGSYMDVDVASAGIVGFKC